MDKKNLKVPENLKVTKIIKKSGTFKREDGTEFTYTTYVFKLENKDNNTFIELKPTPGFKDYVEELVGENELF